MTEGKTSTFTIHHDRCKPENWTASDIITFRDFVRTGSMQNAAALARLGVQLVLSEHHVPKGGQFEEIGSFTSSTMAHSPKRTTMAHDMEEQVTEVVKLIRSQNWKYGGALSVDTDEAEAVVMQLVQTAYSKGLVDATKQTSESMMQAFESVSAR